MNPYADIKVLIVDDYKTMLRILHNLLDQIGMTHIDEAMDGPSAMKLLENNVYDLVISDWAMEPLSGIDLLKTLRASNNPNRAIPFLMVTAQNKTENIVAAQHAGVNNYVIKPFSFDTLKAKIDAVLNITSNS